MSSAQQLADYLLHSPYLGLWFLFVLALIIMGAFVKTLLFPKGPRPVIVKDLGRVVVNVSFDNTHMDFEFRGTGFRYGGEVLVTDAQYYANKFIKGESPIDVTLAIRDDGYPNITETKEDAVQEHKYWPRKRVILYKSKREPLIQEFD